MEWRKILLNQPLIKWTGSKRPLLKDILKYFPKKIDCYYEPFVGGGSVFWGVLSSQEIECNNFHINDINSSLIGIYNMVRNDHVSLITEYEKHWKMLQADAEYYYFARNEYNLTKSPSIFYFLTRTCYNGTIRYNSKGDFNTSFHFNRKGMNPDKINDIINYYHGLMKDRNVTITCGDYFNLPSSENSVTYLDPPYTNSKSLYQGNIDIEMLVNYINSLKGKWYMNINGINGTDNEIQMPLNNCEKILIKSGNSSFSRLKNKIVNVEEYFYYKR